MTLLRARRGRPKGTGIDDSDRIARLVELLRVHPELKPTTAIRLMGFSDPSAIRRLRDKYKLIMQSSHTPFVAADKPAISSQSASCGTDLKPAAASAPSLR